MAGVVPAIHALFHCISKEGRKTWTPGTRPGMTMRTVLISSLHLRFFPLRCFLAVLAERTRARAHLGQKVHQRRRERLLLEAIVHVLPALLAPHDAGILEHR